MLMQPDSLVGKRAHFATKSLFVTPYAEGQLYPAGDHVVQSEDCLGLKTWLEEVRPPRPRDANWQYVQYVQCVQCVLGASAWH